MKYKNIPVEDDLFYALSEQKLQLEKETRKRFNWTTFINLYFYRHLPKLVKKNKGEKE